MLASVYGTSVASNVLRETFDEDEPGNVFIYDIPTRPKFMLGQVKVHENHLC